VETTLSHPFMTITKPVFTKMLLPNEAIFKEACIEFLETPTAGSVADAR
jgi:hypothetical protein